MKKKKERKENTKYFRANWRQKRDERRFLLSKRLQLKSRRVNLHVSKEDFTTWGWHQTHLDEGEELIHMK
jgi:hypothetical protein